MKIRANTIVKIGDKYYSEKSTLIVEVTKIRLPVIYYDMSLDNKHAKDDCNFDEFKLNLQRHNYKRIR